MGQLKLKTKELIDAQGALSALGKQTKLPGKTIRQVARLLRVVGDHLDDYQKASKAVFERYESKENSEGGLSIVPQQLSYYRAEIDEMNEEVVVLDGVARLDYEKLEDLHEKKKLEMSGAMISGLMPFLKKLRRA